MTASDLQALLVAALVRTGGGAPRRWRRQLGEIRLYSLATHSHCNWAIAPTGSDREVDLIERLIDDMRLRHPIITAG